MNAGVYNHAQITFMKLLSTVIFTNLKILESNIITCKMCILDERVQDVA
jgi:hypothetical protein